jgi:hypothetical protein
MSKYLKDASWIAAFILLCAVWTHEVIRASQKSESRARAKRDTADIWICPILGKCGPPGTPGLGRW